MLNLKKFLAISGVIILGIAFLSGAVLFAFYSVWIPFAICIALMGVLYTTTKKTDLFKKHLIALITQEEFLKITLDGQYRIIQKSKDIHLALWHCDLGFTEKEITYKKSDQKFFFVGQGLSFKSIHIETDPINRNDSYKVERFCSIETEFGQWKLRTLPSFVDAYLIICEIVTMYERSNISGFNCNLLYMDESGFIMILELNQHMGYYGNYDFRLSIKKLEDLKPGKDLILYAEYKKSYTKNQYGFVTTVNIF